MRVVQQSSVANCGRLDVGLHSVECLLFLTIFIAVVINIIICHSCFDCTDVTRRQNKRFSVVFCHFARFYLLIYCSSWFNFILIRRFSGKLHKISK